MRKNSQILFDIINNNTKKEAYNKLKNCFNGKKCFLFSCGDNLIEHQADFDKILFNDDYLIAAYKSSIDVLNYNCDIIGIGNWINGSYLQNNKINEVFKVLFTSDEWNKNYSNTNSTIDSFNLSIIKKNTKSYYSPNDELVFDQDFKINDYYSCDIYCFIVFLKYLGIKELYLFGCYGSDKVINLLNYTYENDIVVRKAHHYENNQNIIRTIEPGWFFDQYQSSLLGIDKTIVIYNVSKYGCLSNNIKRIDFNSIFLDNKNYINSENTYEDIKNQLDKYLDINFYSKKYNVKNNTIDCITDYFYIGYLLNRKLFKKDKKKELLIDKFNLEGVTCINHMFNYIFYSNNICAFMCHYYIYCKKFFYLIYNVKKDIIYNLQNKYKVENYKELLIKLFEIHNLPDDFNWKEYIKIHNDLNQMKEFEAKTHYIVYGKNENRKYKYELPIDFNWKEYIEINKDLSHMNEIEAINHYIIDGKNEKRIYKYDLQEDFNWKEYIEINKDLNYMNEIEAKIHYMINGKRENRRYRYDLPYEV